MNQARTEPDIELIKKNLGRMVGPYQHANPRHSVFQLFNTLLPYIALWVIMYFSLGVSYWLTLLLAIPAAGFLVRIFIFFHDCGHNSFFPKKSTNQWVGFFLGLLVFTPSLHWWHEHNLHHATAGNLDKRGVGDVTTMTLEEYRLAPPMQKLGYRLFRHPLIMFVLGPIFMFLIRHRFATPGSPRSARMSVVFANLSLLAIAAGMSLLIGWKAYVLIQLPVIWLAGAAGIWLFYHQHQYENMYWARSGQWDYITSAMKGASCYLLPAWLQWFSGYIGYHQIHHLSPRIPNYNLPACYNANPELQAAETFTLSSSLKNLSVRLWDEKNQKMVGFSALKNVPFQ
jgi:omega-6 fatty acid desaturase (delta-12 desaturase)